MQDLLNGCLVCPQLFSLQLDDFDDLADDVYHFVLVLELLVQTLLHRQGAQVPLQ